MPVGFSAPPCLQAQPPSRKEKQSWEKKVVLGEKGGKPRSCSQGVKNLCLQGVCSKSCSTRCRGISFCPFIPGFSFFHPLPKFFHSCCQATRSRSDGETLSLSVSVLPHVTSSYPLNPKDYKMLSAPTLHCTVCWWCFSSSVSCLVIHHINWPSQLERWQNVCPDLCWGMCICIWGWWIMHLCMHAVWCASETECSAEYKWRRAPLKSSIIRLNECKR